MCNPILSRGSATAFALLGGYESLPIDRVVSFGKILIFFPKNCDKSFASKRF